MSLRAKLLLLALLTLVLPWAGCQYAREMESVLRTAEEQALTAVAQSVAASLRGRLDLLYHAADPDDMLAAGPLDLQPVPLAGEPLLDAYAEEWPAAAPVGRSVRHGEDELRVLAGLHGRMLYLLIEVRDDVLVTDAPAAAPLDSGALGDRIWIGFADADGRERQVFLPLAAPGAVRARRIEPLEYGEQTAVEEPRIEGAWQPAPHGYRAEVRVPLSLVARRLGVLIDDRDVRGAAPSSYGTLDPETLHTLGRLVAPAPALGGHLAQFLQPGMRLEVTTPAGVTLAAVDALAVPAAAGGDAGVLPRLFRRFLERGGGRRLVHVGAEIRDADERVVGRLEITQAAERWLTLQDRALTRLLGFTLFATALAVIAMFAFAARLAYRLARLRRASETALTREGLVTTFPETGARDELGDLARGFATLLGRLGEYTGYLRTLAGKLAHEIRTPLTIVRSSLENLESEGVSDSARVYLARAREGSERLNAILHAMGAASRVEEAIQSAERTRFDLLPVVASAVDSYRTAFPGRRFAAELPHQPLVIEGAPDLVVQMLDKLVENAVDFSPEGATITVRLTAEPDAAVIDVENPGPGLAPGTAGRLFESLWQFRSGSDSRPHFGLGLYIVRLIAEFHGGRAEAANLPGGGGARFSVWLARR